MANVITKTVIAVSASELDKRIKEASQDHKILNVSHSAYQDRGSIRYSAVITMESERLNLVEG